MNLTIFQEKIYYLVIKEKKYNKLNLHNHFLEKRLENNQKQQKKSKILLGEAGKKQRNLLNTILKFNTRIRQKVKADKKKTRDTYESINALHESR